MLLLLLVRLLRLTLARILKLNFLGRITRSPDGRACACSPTAHTRSPPFAPTRTQPRNLAEPPLARSLARFARSLARQICSLGHFTASLASACARTLFGGALRLWSSCLDRLAPPLGPEPKVAALFVFWLHLVRVRRGSE
ncbi:uncharacterized protein PSANT_05416 [Moesziomyces antarcticus]|uniref:Secreted protein n=1 Tax=Pseudozyma antarctica TaxID=84753 RepID=A0A5C3FTG1_PSEA2|nr:uncharacterized protein PSANT_05416 [Moesziomyces antarcticus]